MKLETNSEGFNFSSFDCETSDEIEVHIRQSSAKPLDEIWLNSELYPCLAILISGDLACVDYFEDDQGHFYQSVGDLDADETVKCIVGCEPTELTANIFIPLEKAIQCARDFFNSQERSSCIKWEAMWE